MGITRCLPYSTALAWQSTHLGHEPEQEGCNAELWRLQGRGRRSAATVLEVKVCRSIPEALDEREPDNLSVRAKE